jgi:hypothetical protein
LSGLALIAYLQKDYFEATDLLHKVLAKTPEDEVCAALLDSILSDLSTNDKVCLFPAFEQNFLDLEVLEQQMKEKFEEIDESIEFPEYEGPTEDELVSEDQELGLLQGFEGRKSDVGMLTRGKLRGRNSAAADLSPDIFTSTKKGLLNFQVSSPNNEGPRTPPRVKRHLFLSRNRDSSPFDSPDVGNSSIGGLDVFQSFDHDEQEMNEDDDDMELDVSDDSAPF